jgi:uncharacterized membrane protein YgaE (UPF0421/DUF939 family)
MKFLKLIKNNLHIIIPFIIISIIIGILFFLGRNLLELLLTGIGGFFATIGINWLKKNNDKKEKEFKEDVKNIDDELIEIERSGNNETKRINNLNSSNLLNEVNKYNRNRNK